VRQVPQAAQKPRVTGAEERNSASAPCVTRKPLRSKVAQATAGEPAARRQLSQWQ